MAVVILQIVSLTSLFMTTSSQKFRKNFVASFKPACPVGTYRKDLDGHSYQCNACHATCSTKHRCNGPLAKNCDFCLDGKPKPKGLAECSNVKTQDKQKSVLPSQVEPKPCSPGTYRFVRADGTIFCLDCHPTCHPDHLCDGPLTENCRVCRNGEHKPPGLATCPRVQPVETVKPVTRKSGTMKQSCDVSSSPCQAGYYCNEATGKVNSCEKCHVYCNHNYTCNGPRPNDCLYCKDGSIRQPGDLCTGPPPCLIDPKPCPVGTYCNERADRTTTCPACHHSCDVRYPCDGPLSEQCQVCKGGAPKPQGFVPCQSQRSYSISSAWGLTNYKSVNVYLLASTVYVCTHRVILIVHYDSV